MGGHYVVTCHPRRLCDSSSPTFAFAFWSGGDQLTLSHALTIVCFTTGTKEQSQSVRNLPNFEVKSIFFKKVSYFRCFILVMRILVMNLECFIYFEEQMYFDLDSVNEN